MTTTAAGRPRTAETRRRTGEFVRLILDGADFDQAAAIARVKPVRALAILTELERQRMIHVAGRRETAP